MSRRKPKVLTSASRSRADQISWFLLVFGVVRMAAWILMMICVGLGMLGVPEFRWASSSAKLIWFVAMISFYANAATDLDAVTAAWAAIRAGRAQHQAASTESSGLIGTAEILKQIKRDTSDTLAELRERED